MVEAIVLVVSAFVAAVVLTWQLRSYALHRALLDIPNERSSHATTTPRGGGLAIVITVLAAAGWLHYRQFLPPELSQALFGGGLAVALIGWVDDHRPLGVAVRAIVHLMAAAWTVFAFGGIADLEMGFARIPLGMLLGSLLTIVGITWLINLYNFLDGTDGYAATQAVCAALAGAVLFRVAGQSSVAVLCMVLAAASAGFLMWNWSPAKIFMGDGGSYFLGYVFGVLALYGEKSATVPAFLWLILLGVFVWDASLTLLRRLFTGERWYEAHRSHAYQRLHQMGSSHQRIAALLIFVNVVLLWPLAYWASLRPGFLLLSLVISVLLLSALWLAIQVKFARR